MIPPPWVISPMGAQEEQEASRGDTRSTSGSGTRPDAPSTSGSGARSNAHSSESRDEPMETGRAGDGATWGDQMDATEWTGRARKHCQSHSRKQEHQPPVPFSLQDDRERWEVAHILYRHVGEQGPSTQQTARGMRLCHPDSESKALTRLNNQVLLMIAEYHLAKASQGTHSVTPILPEALELMLPPLDEYLLGELQGSRDVRVADRANTLHVATWLHRLDLTSNYGRAVTISLEVDRYDMGPLLGYFLALGTTGLTFEDVTRRVLLENR